MKRSDEEEAKAAFDLVLEEIYPEKRRLWIDGSVGKAPDYFLEIDGRRSAIEITAVPEYLDPDKSRVSRRSVTRTFQKYVDDLGKRAAAEGTLSGTYVIRGAVTIAFSREQKTIAANVLRFISTTRSADRAERFKVFEAGRDSWYVEKISGDESDVHGCLFFRPRWSREAGIELRHAVTKVLEKKAGKLEQHGAPQPWTLLLLDAYNYADLGAWYEAVRRAPSLNRFHTICLVTQGHARLLHSQDPQWASLLPMAEV